MSLIPSANNKGITLTELVVASALIGIVMIGVVSMNFAIKQFQSSTSGSTLIAMRTSIAMSRLRSDAFLSINDDNATVGVIETGATYCFKQADNDIDDVTSTEDWACWETTGAGDLIRCAQQTTSVASCPGGSQTFSNSSPIFSTITIVTNADAQLEHIDIELRGRFLLGSADPAIDPTVDINNPAYTLTSQVNPPGHSGFSNN